MKKLISSLGILAVLALTGCGSTVASSNASQAPIAPAASADKPVESAPAEADKSPRGNFIKKIGDTSEFKANTSSKAVGTFAVTKIEDVKCTDQYAGPATNGKIIGLTVDLETTPDLAKESVPEVFLSPMSFKYIADNGTTFNGNLSSGATYGCIDKSLVLASSFGPAEKAHGVILLDVPAAGGVLTIGKVEWKLP